MKCIRLLFRIITVIALCAFMFYIVDYSSGVRYCDLLRTPASAVNLSQQLTISLSNAAEGPKKIAVIGTGYVGLITGTCLADLGNNVTTTDIDKAKIEILNRGDIPIYEPGLLEMVKNNTSEGRLFFTDDVRDAVRKCDIIFLAVGTPSMPDGSADLRYIEAAAEDIAGAMDRRKIIIVKSTVPPGTCRNLEEIISRNTNIGFDIVFNPEFLREGSAVSDFMHPDRVVLGSRNKIAAEAVAKLYKSFNVPIVITNLESAELIKYAANSFLAGKISFINAVANLCESIGADVVDVARGIGLDSRIGQAFLYAGLGYGGSCFPKDVSALIDLVRTGDKAPELQSLLEVIVRINKEQRYKFIQKIEEAFGGVKGKTIGVLGLSFKPNTDDMREAPAMDIIRILQDKGAIIKAYDPIAMENAKQVLKGVIFCSDPYEAAEASDGLLVITEWDEFRRLDLQRIIALLNRPLVIDGRNIYDPFNMAELGFKYVCVGRPSVPLAEKTRNVAKDFLASNMSGSRPESPIGSNETIAAGLSILSAA